jgi:hypothetical protein
MDLYIFVHPNICIYLFVQHIPPFELGHISDRIECIFLEFCPSVRILFIHITFQK